MKYSRTRRESYKDTKFFFHELFKRTILLLAPVVELNKGEHWNVVKGCGYANENGSVRSLQQLILHNGWNSPFILTMFYTIRLKLLWRMYIRTLFKLSFYIVFHFAVSSTKVEFIYFLFMLSSKVIYREIA